MKKDSNTYLHSNISVDLFLLQTITYDFDNNFPIIVSSLYLELVRGGSRDAQSFLSTDTSSNS